MSNANRSFVVAFLTFGFGGKGGLGSGGKNAASEANIEIRARGAEEEHASEFLCFGAGGENATDR